MPQRNKRTRTGGSASADTGSLLLKAWRPVAALCREYAGKIAGNVFSAIFESTAAHLSVDEIDGCRSFIDESAGAFMAAEGAGFSRKLRETMIKDARGDTINTLAGEFIGAYFEANVETFHENYAETEKTIRDDVFKTVGQMDHSEFTRVFSVKIEPFYKQAGAEIKRRMRRRVERISGYIKTAETTADALLIMAGDMRAVFASVCNYYDDNMTALTAAIIGETDAAIVSGIHETVSIKLDAVGEAAEAFAAEAEGIIGVYKDGAGGIDGAVKDATRQAALLLSGNSGALTSAKTLSAIDTAASEAIATLNEKTRRTAQKLSDATENCMKKFLREQLLYEMTTFEEVMRYSVPRLTESGAAAAYAAVLDEGYNDLQKILEGNGVEIIHPAIGDMFDGRRHEVLMAETSPDHKKGEIIKAVGSGYVYKGTVLIRANVIAAK